MAGKNRTEKPGMTLYQQLANQPHAFDFYQTLRRLEAMHRALPRIGDAVKPADEPVRLAQEPSLTFAPANLSSAEQCANGRLRLTFRFLGLFGPQGALPMHLTELTRERQRSHGDPTLARFADLFHHRLLSAFYRAWRQAQPTASQDRPETDRFTLYLDALFGGGAERDALPANAKRFFTGHLARRVRNASGLEAIVSSHFDLPVALQPFHAQWMRLPPEQRSALATGKNNCLGRSVLIGQRVWDAQHHFQLDLGPLTLAQYQQLVPDGAISLQLRDWVRLYTDRQYDWRAQLLLKREEVPPLQLGRRVQLGWTTWLGRPPAGPFMKGHLLHPERTRMPQHAVAPSRENTPPAGCFSSQEESCLK